MSLPGWDAAALEALASGTVRPVFLFNMATPTPLRLSSGVGTRTFGGEEWNGVGELLNVPALQQLINGQAERVTFSLSGVPAAVMALADEDADTVRGAMVQVGAAVLDGSWQPIPTAIATFWTGEADAVEVQALSGDDGGAVRTISLSVGTLLTGRRRARLAHWTDAEQRRRSPDDRFCERTPQYSAGSTKNWPD